MELVVVVVEGGAEAGGLAGRNRQQRGRDGGGERDHAEAGPEGHEVCAAVVLAEDGVLLEAGLVFGGEEDFVVEDAVGVAVGGGGGDGGGFVDDGVRAVERHVGFGFEVEGVDVGTAAGEVVAAAGDEAGEWAAVEFVVLEGLGEPGGFGEVDVDEAVEVE